MGDLFLSTTTIDPLAFRNLTSNSSQINESFISNKDEQAFGARFTKLKITIILIYIFIFLAIFFNLRVIYMVLNILRRQHSPSRHGAGGDSRHPFVYVLALSIVDALVLAHMPIAATDIIVQQWVFGSVICKLYWIIEMINRTLSTFILTALSFDRFIAVCHPLGFRQLRNTRAATSVIAGCVLLASLLLIPAYSTDVFVLTLHGNRTIVKCVFNVDDYIVDNRGYLIYMFICCYCIPFQLMLFFYGCILRTLWRRHAAATAASAGGATAVWTQRGQHRAQQVTQRALLLVLFYFFCWTPFWSVQFYIQFGNTDAMGQNDADVVIFIMYAVHVLAYLNSAVNPFLYALLNKELQRQHSSGSGSGSGGGAASAPLLVQQRSIVQLQHQQQNNHINHNHSNEPVIFMKEIEKDLQSPHQSMAIENKQLLITNNHDNHYVVRNSGILLLDEKDSMKSNEDNNRKNTISNSLASVIRRSFTRNGILKKRNLCQENSNDGDANNQMPLLTCQQSSSTFYNTTERDQKNNHQIKNGYHSVPVGREKIG